MRSSNSLSFSLALFIILFAIQFSFFSKNIVKEYEKLINNDYNIILVSTKDLTEHDIRAIVPTFLNLEILSSQKIINKLNNDISNKNLAILQNTLPKFYRLKLNSLPSTEYMKDIRSKLIRLDGISKVETFSRTHNKVYKTLILTKFISYIFIGLVAFVGILLMSKQIKIWVYEHQERIDIMTLFGAGFWLKSGILYKSAFISSLISCSAVFTCFYFLPNLGLVKEKTDEISINLPRISIDEFGILFAIALVLSFFMVSMVMRKVK